MKRFGFVLLVLMLSFLIVNVVSAGPVKIFAKRIFPDAAEVKEIEDVKGAYTCIDSSGTKLGTVYDTGAFATDVKGYAGKVPLLIGVNSDEKVVDVILMKNMETPMFLKRVLKSGLLSKWNNIDIHKVKDIDVDAVSGATFTSKAIIESIRLTAESVSADKQ